MKSGEHNLEMSANDDICPVCGLKQSGGTLPGKCPRCLLKVEMDGTTGGAMSSNIASKAVTMPPGEIFGPYRIIRFLGKGGMGTTYEAEEIESCRHVALKVMREALDSTELRRRFLREGRLAASVNHPNSVYVFRAEEINNIPSIAMELLPGGTLHDKVKVEGPLPVAEAVDCALQIIAGLDAAQSHGIIHRDVKPSNCFLEHDGTIKIGDYGLSVSSASRWDSTLTVNGTFIGTPAFCSPEQIRGEEMTVRSDIFSLGITLYYLLTGRTPFESENMMQLISLILERNPDSPCRLRKEVPSELGSIIMRCLEKLPEKRFSRYTELRQSLSPFSSTASNPASWGSRILSGIIDGAMLGCTNTLLLFMAMRTPPFMHSSEPFSMENVNSVAMAIFGGISFVMTLAYYSILEGIWGTSVGKAVFGLRLIRLDHSKAGVSRALLRSFLFVLMPSAFSVIYFFWSSSGPVLYQSYGFLSSIFLALLFCTARRRNGFAGLHDLASGTRVVEKSATLSRPNSEQAAMEFPIKSDNAVHIGPYQILDTICKADAASVILGFDPRLLRKVWIRTYHVGTPPLADNVIKTSRRGRSRWLTGRRSDIESWDAYELPSGKSFLGRIKTKQEWGTIRFWLLDIAEELHAAMNNGSLPKELALDRIWITDDGRAKLLDFPAPGENPTSAIPSFSNLDSSQNICAWFLRQTALSALLGRPLTMEEAHVITPPVPLAMHALEVLDECQKNKHLETITEKVMSCLTKRPSLTWRHRLGVVAAHTSIPILFFLFALAFSLSLAAWHVNPDVMQELSSDLAGYQSIVEDQEVMRIIDQERLSALEVYIAGRYGKIIHKHAGNPKIFDMANGRAGIDDIRWRTANAIVAKHPSVSPEALAYAVSKKCIEPGRDYGRTKELDFDGKWKEPPIIFCFFFCLLVSVQIGIVAVILSVFLHGGTSRFFLGLAISDNKGKLASRQRIFCRSALPWAPWMLLLFALLFYNSHVQWILTPQFAWAWLALWTALMVLSLILPGRGLADRLCGTWLVPR